MRCNLESNILITFLSVLVSTVFFFSSLYPEVARKSFSHHLCTITDNTLSSKYCCRQLCNECSEAPPLAPLCSGLIAKTHLKKNATLCPVDKSFCADEGAFCHNGWTCCVNYDGQCEVSVKRNLCQMHCPECYSVSLSYTYSVVVNGKPEVFTVVRDTDFKEEKELAERFLQGHRVNTVLDCYVNPSNVHDVLFTKNYTWWKILVVCLAILPALINLALLLAELALALFLRGSRYLPISSLDMPDDRTPLLSSTENLQLPAYEESNRSISPPPKYEDIDNIDNITVA